MILTELLTSKAIEELDALRLADPKYQAALQADKKRMQQYQSSIIYLVRSAGVHKIGFTTSIKDRMKSIQAMCPKPLVVVKTAPGCRLQEKMMHHMFRTRHSHGEWFKLTNDDVIDAVSFMESIERNRERNKKVKT